jgi:WD40 repeat protein
VFSGDGNMLYREEWRTQGGKLLLAQVVARDLRAGQEKVIHRTREKDQAPIRDMALSPDGKQLASLNGRKKIYVFPVTGEDPQNLPLYSARGNVGEAFHAIAWHPDGKSVLASMNRYHATGELWRIPVGGGQPETWPLRFRSVELHVHPDGRRVGLTAWGHGNEVWALENFLPVVAK